MPISSEDRAHGVVAAGREAEEAEDGRLADDQAKLGAGDVGLGALLHAHRHDTEGLDRRRNARDGRSRGFQTHVIRPGHAAVNPHAPTTADLAVIQRSRTSIPASVAAQTA